jgi:hypothetical protein
MTGEHRTGKDLEGSDCNLTEVYYPNICLEGMTKTTKKHNSR